MTTVPSSHALADPVSISGWSEDEDFAIHPYGTKAKRTLISPDAPGNPLLVPGHHYLFKRAEDWKARQMWSEAIAFQIGSAVGLPVPPCFIGVDEKVGETGALIEFFYGYPGEERAARLEHGADLLQGAGLMDGRGRPHAVTVNLAFCEARGIPDAELWWGQVLVFDALIGNTDRHAQNWGFLVDANGTERMAPMFDNGTSLAYQIADAAVGSAIAPESIGRFVSKGRHSFDWSVADTVAYDHARMCGRFAAEHPQALAAMRAVASIGDETIEGFLQACTAIDVSPAFSSARAEMVAALISKRREAILLALDQTT